MTYFIGLLLSCIVTMYVYFNIIEYIYGRKYPTKRWIYKLAFIICVILNIMVAWIQISLLNVVYSVTVLCVLSYILHDSKGKNTILNSTVVIVYMSIVDLFVTTVYSAFYRNSVVDALHNSEIYFVSSIGNAIVLLCTYDIMKQILKKHKFNKISKKLNVYMFFLIIFEFGVLYYLLVLNNEVNNNIPLLCVSLGFIGVDAGVLYLFNQASKSMGLEKRAELLEQQRILTEKYYEGLQMRYEDSMRQLHDVKKHLQVLNNLEPNDKVLKKNYTDKLLKKFESNGDYFQCTDKIVCTIFWDKILICKQYNIRFDINMQDIEFCFMDKTEVTSLFANLLDNAIESCRKSKSENKEINLRIHKFKEYVVIKMKNTLGMLPREENTRLISTKCGHTGLGMEILNEIANKYGGDLNYDFSDGYFETKIILCVNEQVQNRFFRF